MKKKKKRWDGAEKERERGREGGGLDGWKDKRMDREAGFGEQEKLIIQLVCWDASVRK